MVTNAILLAAFTVTKPTAIGIGVGALVILFLAFKVSKFIVKMLLMLAALTAIGLAAWWYFSAQHGSV